MRDYIISNPHLIAGKDSEGKDIVYVNGKIQAWDIENNRIDYRHQIRNAPIENFFPGEMEDLIPTLRAMFPKAGTWKDEDGEEHPWLGERELAQGEVFNFLKYKEVCKNIAQEGVTLLCDGKFRMIPFDYPMVQLYSRDMGKKSTVDAAGNKVYTNEPLYKKDTPVCYKDSNIVKVYREVECFSLLEKEGADWKTDECRGGWSWLTRRKSKENLYMRLDVFLEKQKTDATLAAYKVADTDMPGFNATVDEPNQVNEPPVS